MKTNKLAIIAAVASFSALAIPEGPEPNTPEWFQREALNYARTLEGPTEQVSPAFQQRLQMQNLANQMSFNQRAIDDPSWLLVSGNTPLTPLCSTWMFQCAGDPFRYPGVDPFYDNDGEVTPFVYYDEGCARISGRVWKPKNATAGARLPGVVIETGSIQAPETLYWWMAQALVRSGYAVMTFDVRGQGRSDQQTPTGDQGSNANSSVFFDGLVNAIDFFRSSPAVPYPHNLSCAGTYATEVAPHNPQHEVLDLTRLGIAGHSLGASGVSAVQGYNPWPGLLDSQNPVDVIVAWDSLSAATGVTPRVPALGQSSEYGIGGTAFRAPPDPEADKAAYQAWKEAGVPVIQQTIQGSTHFEWSLIPTFPATSWCPTVGPNGCEGGWGRPMAEHYSMAWFDRWLKTPGEPGYDNADARLLDDASWCDRHSFYLRSARHFPTRAGAMQNSEDIRAECLAKASPAAPTKQGGGLLAGAFAGSTLVMLMLGALGLRGRRVQPNNN